MKYKITTTKEVVGGVEVIKVVKEKPFVSEEKYTRDELVEHLNFYKVLLDQFDKNLGESQRELTIVK